MSNSTDFTSFHIPSLPSGTFTDSHCQYLNQQSQDFSGHQLITKHCIEHKRSIGSFTDRTDDLLSQSTNDSPANSNHTSRLDDSLLSPTILKRVSSIDCQHVNTITKRCTYCKDCGLFLPTSGSTVHRESTYNEKLTTCPDEVYSIMLQNETNNREYHVDAPHLEMRKTLTDWIFQVSQDLKLSPNTTCAIISYVDTILCREEVSKENLQLVILTCLIVATKFLEMDNKVPSMREAYNLAQGVYPLEIFKTAELHILDQLDWNLTVVSPFQYVHYYLSRGCVFSSDKTIFGSVNIEALQYLRKYSECFVNYSMDNYQFNQFRSHIVACAAIANTRKMIGISPLWNPELEELTGASWEDIKPCFDMLFSCFESSFPELLDFSKVLIEKNEKQNVYNDDGLMMTEAHKVCVKEESDRKILKNAISTKNKESSSRKKQSNKKHLARFNKKPTHQNKYEEPDALEITEEMLDQFSDSKGTGDVKTRL